jgi:hypothetical protein
MSDIDKAIDAAVIVLSEELRQIIKNERTKREQLSALLYQICLG